MGKTNYEKWLSKRAKELRAAPTKAETRMLSFLREHKIPYKSQVPILIDENKGYIVDFVLFKKIILEIDGSIHYLEENKKNDRQRTKDLESKGYKVIRMRNGSTDINNIHRVLINRFEKVAPGTAKRLQNETNKKTRKNKSRTHNNQRINLQDWNFKERVWDLSGGHFK
jgi:very-short-patch-repair endonuclease